MDSREEVSRGLLVAGGDAPELLENVEEPFDEIAFAIEDEVAIALVFAVRPWRDHDCNVTHFQTLHEGVAVVALVGEDRPGLDPSDERLGLFDVVNLAAGEADEKRIAECVHNRVDFRRQPAARAANGFVAPFFIAPALC